MLGKTFSRLFVKIKAATRHFNVKTLKKIANSGGSSRQRSTVALYGKDINVAGMCICLESE